uniref:NADH-ubiquinone oxidoreductase chain 2 n=1 Tax=Saron marmoratus TaxID=1055079 RepID=A0A7G7WQG2_9EUCA|nr:NADH dehydrogenase subunit 2 [Saron marmoratus]QNH68789.1 NADH dehydrogenase subunit 2 [Saron marmoratus]
MLLTLSKMTFLSTLMLGVIIATSSTSWFTAWMGLELNLLSFLPLITSKTNMYTSEAALKYFLVQALGSAIIVSTTPITMVAQNLTHTPDIMITSALLMKMGAAPFHFWFPSVMQGISWPLCIILMTIQKIAPIMLLSHIIINSYSSLIQIIIMTSSLLSGIIGGFSGLNQTLMRTIMAYSSINHMGWMLAAIVISKPLWSYYFFIYALVSSSVIMIFYTNQIFHFNQISLIHPSMLTKMSFFMSLLSLGGLPPFLGFLPKMLIIKELSSLSQIIWLIFLLVSTLLVLFFYLRIMSTTLLLSSITMKTQLYKSSKTINLTIIFLNLTPMFTPNHTLLPF